MDMQTARRLSMYGKDIPHWSRNLVKARCLERCERCGGPGAQWHHRRGRGVVDDHRHCPCNGVWLCPTCHRWCHENPKMATIEGFIVSRSVALPGSWGFRHYQGQWVHTDCEGNLVSTVETKEG